jgi:hypothetical protein
MIIDLLKSQVNQVFYDSEKIFDISMLEFHKIKQLKKEIESKSGLIFPFYDIFTKPNQHIKPRKLLIQVI